MLKKPMISNENVPLKLERIIGHTSLHTSSLTGNNKGDIFYSAGSISVRYNSNENRQKQYFYSSNRAITCQVVSNDGKYLAFGDKGHQPAVTVWDIENKEKLVTLSGHKHGIGCLTFSSTGKYIISAGFKHDRQLIIWDWINLKIVSTLKLTNKVYSISFHDTGKYFVTCGDRHLKWWYIDYNDDDEIVDVIGKPASILEDHRNAIFMDVYCGPGIYESNVYCVTSTGILCLFLESSRMMNQWIQLESKSAYCLSLILTSDLKSGYLIVGCSDGIIRIFSPDNLLYLSTFPLPCPINNENDESVVSDSVVVYPACYAVKAITNPNSKNLSASSQSVKIAAIYSDHSLFVWNITDINNISKYRSFQSHRGCIWDIQCIDIPVTDGVSNNELELNSSPLEFVLPSNSFVTCSSDNTIKFWNIDSLHNKQQSKWNSMYSKEMLHSIELASLSDDSNSSVSISSSSNLQITHDNQSITSSVSIPSHTSYRSFIDLTSNIPDYELPDKQQSSITPRTVSVDSVLGHLAIGDRNGRLRIFDIVTMKEIHMIQAHSAEILTMHYSPSMRRNLSTGCWSVDVQEDDDGNDKADVWSESVVLLATAGRDRLIHVFNAKNNYNVVKTLDNHSSSITTVRFTSDGSKLLSCSGDHTLVFSSIHGEGPTLSRQRSIQTPNGVMINGLAIETSNKFVITSSSGKDRRINIYNINSGKHVRAYKTITNNFSNGIDGIGTRLSDLDISRMNISSSSSSIGVSSLNNNSELYKCDVDPSGSYVCVCSFDKVIHLIDFFSGDVICSQVSGHSELITCVRFSLDGNRVVSVSGDGCINVWRLSDKIVQVMRDRLMELYSKAQRKQTKAILRQSISEQYNLTQPTADTTSLSKDLSNAVLQNQIVQSQWQSENDNRVGAKNRNNKWVSRVADEGGEYEIFGKKVSAASEGTELTARASAESSESVGIVGIKNPNRKKLTLELTSHTVAAIREGLNENREQGAGDSDDDDELDDEMDEAFDDLNISRIEEDFATAGNEEADNSLIEAKSAIDTLEKSAKNLEDWLEQMLRNESSLDQNISDVNLDGGCENVIKLMPDDTVKDVTINNTGTPNPLNRSLSSQFFQKLSKRSQLPNESLPESFGKGISVIDNATKNSMTDSLIEGRIATSSTPSAKKDSVGNEGQALEIKRRETAAAVSQMKDRLRAMGILSTTGTLASARKNRSHYSTDALPNPVPVTTDAELTSLKAEILYPPLPPSIIKSKRQTQTESSVTDNVDTLDTSEYTNDTMSDEDGDINIGHSPHCESIVERTRLDSQSQMSAQQLNLPKIDGMQSPALMMRVNPLRYGLEFNTANLESIFSTPQQTPNVNKAIPSTQVEESLDDVLHQRQYKIKEAAETCRKSLRDLDKAKENAMMTLREYITLQEHINIGLVASSTDSIAFTQESQTSSDLVMATASAHINSYPSKYHSTNDREETTELSSDDFIKTLRESINEETQDILREYKRSMEAMTHSSHMLSNLQSPQPLPSLNSLREGLGSPEYSQYIHSDHNNISHKHNSDSVSTSLGLGFGVGTASSSGNSGLDLNISIMLEKYSDKLLDLVSSKIASKLVAASTSKATAISDQDS